MSAIDPSIPGQLADLLPPDEFLLILRTFEDDLTRLVSAFESAAAAQDARELRLAAHSIAGTAAGIGARDLEAAARRALHPEPSPPMPALLGHVRAEAATALAALAALRAQAPG